MEIVRATALLALLAGCGGDDDATKPSTDGGGLDGGSDAGRDGGDIDAGSDAGADACVTGPASDGGSALIAALRIEGVVTTGERARLIAPAYCALWTSCVADAGTAEACATSSIDDYTTTADAGTPASCLDAVLDLWACLAVRDTCASSQCTAAQARCQAAADVRDTLCDDDAGTSPSAN